MTDHQATQPCGHPQSDETSDGMHTFCAVCAVGGPKPANREATQSEWFWGFIRWLLDRDPEYAKQLIERRQRA